MSERIPVPDSLQVWAKGRPFSERLHLSVLSSEVRLEIMKAANQERNSR